MYAYFSKRFSMVETLYTLVATAMYLLCLAVRNWMFKRYKRKTSFSACRQDCRDYQSIIWSCVKDKNVILIIHFSYDTIMLKCTKLKYKILIKCLSYDTSWKFMFRCLPVTLLCIPVQVLSIPVQVLSIPVQVLSIPVLVLCIPVQVLIIPVLVLCVPVQVLSIPV